MKSLIEIHAIRPLGANNINRDDTGSPKSVVLGDCRRQRISSQCHERARRDYEHRHFGAPPSARTKRIPRIIADRLIGEGQDEEDSLKIACKACELAGLKISKKKDVLTTLVFVTASAVQEFGDIVSENHADILNGKFKDDKALKNALFNKAGAYDCFMYGRMVAKDPIFSIESCRQAAHSFSVGPMNEDFDSFTALDEMNNGEEDAGAGHMDLAQFAASTMYEYSAVNVEQLNDYVKEYGAEIDIKEQLVRRLKSTIFAVPTGKKSMYATNSLPTHILIVVGAETFPLGSMLKAFIKPVENNDPDEAAERLASAFAKTSNMYGSQRDCFFLGQTLPDAIDNDDVVDDVDSLIESVVERALINAGVSEETYV